MAVVILWLWLWSAPCEQPLRAQVIAWLAGVDDVRVCLGSRATGIDPSGTAYLPVDADVRAAAARLAHLARHRHDGALAPPDADCETWLAAQARREAAALAVENELLRRLKARPLPREDVLAGYRSRCPQ